LRFEHALRAAYQDIACGSASAGVGPYGSVGAILSIRSPRPYHPVGALHGIEWVIYTKRPFAGPEQVLAYLGRYTHRVAIANSRLIGLHDNKVNFTWKDYRHHGKTKVMTLAADEFIRRFLLHAVPDGFHRIRHYGFLAKGDRGEKLVRVRELLQVQQAVEPGDEPQAPTNCEPEADASPQPFDACPDCGGLMRRIARVAASTNGAFRCDTS